MMKSSLFKPRSAKIGAQPGSMILVGERKLEKAGIEIITYAQDSCDCRRYESELPVLELPPSPYMTWVNINGLHETKIIEEIGRQFNIHPLTLEDILNTDQRPKAEVFEKYIFMVVKTISPYSKDEPLNIEQVSFLVGENWVVTFQERDSNLFIPVKDRLEKGKGKIRKMGSDYLAYSLLDAIVDNYFLVLEYLAGHIEELEYEVITSPRKHTLPNIHKIKRQLLYMRKSVWPLREELNIVIRDENELVSPGTIPYLRDLYDHTIQVIDTTESFRDMVSGLLDIYLSSLSNKLNEVMKTLTIIATIFIPLTFLCGVYGMNFKYMPELETRYGYFVLWGIFISIALGMVMFFRRKKWF